MTDKNNEDAIKMLYKDEFLSKPQNIIKRNELIKKLPEQEEENTKKAPYNETLKVYFLRKL